MLPTRRDGTMISLGRYDDLARPLFGAVSLRLEASVFGKNKELSARNSQDDQEIAAWIDNLRRGNPDGQIPALSMISKMTADEKRLCASLQTRDDDLRL